MCGPHHRRATPARRPDLLPGTPSSPTSVTVAALLVMTTCASSPTLVAAAPDDQVSPPPWWWPAHHATDMVARVTLAALGAVATGPSTEPGSVAVRQAVADLLRGGQLQRLLSEPRVAEAVSVELVVDGQRHPMAASTQRSPPYRRLLRRSAPIEGGGDMQQRPPEPGGAAPPARPRPTAAVHVPVHRYLQEPVGAACPSPPQVLRAGATRAVLDFSGGYAPNSACGWQLQCADEGKTLLINFTDFNTAGDAGYGVTLFDGSSDKSPPVGRPAHLNGPSVAALTTTGYGSANGTMLVTFTSYDRGDRGSGWGFAAEYWCEKGRRARLGCTEPHATNYDPAPEFQSSCVLPPPQLCLETASLRAGFVVGVDEVAQQAWAQLRGWGSGKSDPCGADGHGGWEGVSCIAGRVTGVSFHGYATASSLQFTVVGPAVAQLTWLRTLDMYGCTRLSGTVPAELGGLAHLQALKMASSAVSGTVPAALGRLTELQQMWLFTTQLSGTIPSGLGALHKLVKLYFYDTFISGTVPAELGGAGAAAETASVLHIGVGDGAGGARRTGAAAVSSSVLHIGVGVGAGGAGWAGAAEVTGHAIHAGVGDGAGGAR